MLGLLKPDLAHCRPISGLLQACKDLTGLLSAYFMLIVGLIVGPSVGPSVGPI